MRKLAGRNAAPIRGSDYRGPDTTYTGDPDTNLFNSCRGSRICSHDLRGGGRSGPPDTCRLELMS
jgi:hypothetical protein